MKSCIGFSVESCRWGCQMKDDLYLLFNLEMNRIAKQVVNMHYENYPEFKVYGLDGYTKSIQDAQYNLQFILTAYQYNNLDILLHYLDWTERLFKNIRLPDNTLLRHLELIKVVIDQWLETISVNDALKNRLVHLLSKSIEWLNERQDVPQTRLDDMILENPYYQRYESAIFNGDREGLNVLFSEIKKEQLGLEFIYGELMEPFQRRLGHLWHEQKISVAKEHYSTAMSQYAMTLLYDQIFTTPRKGRRMFAACVSGELHEFGIRLISDYFEYKGWDTIYYGANNTASSLTQAIKEQKPDIIFLSCTMTYHLENLEKLISEIKSAGITAPIAVGGYPFDVSSVLSAQIGADYYTANFQDAFLLAEEVVMSITEDVK